MPDGSSPIEIITGVPAVTAPAEIDITTADGPYLNRKAARRTAMSLEEGPASARMSR